MSDANKLEKAKEVFETLCRTLDKEDWSYQKDEEKLLIECGARGEDLPMELKVFVDAERSLILLLSSMPGAIQEDKRVDMALAVSVVNNRLVDGSFDYDITSGNLIFRMTNSFLESTISEKLFLYMLLTACRTIDVYNDKFLMLGKGLITIEQFLKGEE